MNVIKHILFYSKVFYIASLNTMFRKILIKKPLIVSTYCTFSLYITVLYT